MNTSAKTIILVAPKDMGISDLISKNLSYCGFKVIKYERPEFKYKNILERLINFFRKLIFKDFSYKSKMQDIKGQALLLEFLHQNKQIDYTLTIRPDMFSDDFLKFLKTISHKNIGYQWDGLDRFPNIFSKIHFFDTFFVFDPMDIQKYPQYNLNLITNFYFDFIQKSKNLLSKNSDTTTAYFVGSHLNQRTPILVKILKDLSQSNINPLFFIAGISGQAQKQSEYQPYLINFLDKNISFEENLDNVEAADILIDVLNDVHGGLSFRAFEAIYYAKKLITNNINIINYDFYNDNNILIWSHQTTVEDIKKFVNKPYQPLSEHIMHKYSFSNWINYILGIYPNTPLNEGYQINNNQLK